MTRGTLPRLPADQREHIVSLLADHPDFRTETDRWTLLDHAFGNFEGAGAIRRDLDLSGNSRMAAERLVERLRSRGCIQGRHTLAPLLERFASCVDEDRRNSLLGLIQDLNALCARPAGGEPCPYLGLNAFTEQDARWFFGREPFVETLSAAVAASPVVVVIGPSGSGKSSVVQAGLFPRLRKRDDWTIASLRPGHDPWASLAGCLGDRLGVEHANALERAQANKRLGQELAAATARPVRNNAALTPADLVQEILAKHPPARRLLLLADQWEELYTHSQPPSEVDDRPVHEHFAEALVETAAAAPLTLVLTLRADFYHRLLDHRALADAVRGAGHVDLSPMNDDELSDAIVAPARKAGLGFEAGLPERILQDLGREPGQLPLLEFCLARLWEHRQDGMLRSVSYHAIGEVRGAIVQRADEVIEGLGAERRAQARDLFLHLVQLDDSAPDTRRRATRAEVGEPAWPLAAELADARLLVTGRDPASGEQTLEVAHEALIRSWPRLRGWLEDAREGLRLQGEVRRAAKLWEDKGRDPNHRWPDVRVMEAAPVLRRIAERFPPGERESAFLGPVEADVMRARLDDPATPDAERAMIGDRLSLLPGGDPRAGVGVTGEGLPDILWCDIPGGEVTLTIDDKAGPDFRVEPFRMAKYQITVAQWRAFLEDPEGYDARIRRRYNGTEPGLQRGKDNQPAVNIAWVEAIAYCEWLGERLTLEPGLTARLPAEWEWQQAACSGHSDWAYPWGTKWAEGTANTTENGLGRMVAVGLYPDGRSRRGVMDLAGNAWDWCLNQYDNPEQTGPGGSGSRVVRGGSWGGGRDDARADYRGVYHPSYRHYGVGFRVLLSSPIR